MTKNLIPILFKVAFFIYLMLVTLFLLVPLPAGGEPLVNDKVAHALIFFLLAFLFERAYPQFKFTTILAPILVCYGFSIEVIQGVSGYRNFSMLDFGADIIGIILYMCAVGLVYKIFRSQTAKI